MPGPPRGAPDLGGLSGFLEGRCVSGCPRACFGDADGERQRRRGDQLLEVGHDPRRPVGSRHECADSVLRVIEPCTRKPRDHRGFHLGGDFAPGGHRFRWVPSIPVRDDHHGVRALQVRLESAGKRADTPRIAVATRERLEELRHEVRLQEPVDQIQLSDRDGRVGSDRRQHGACTGWRRLDDDGEPPHLFLADRQRFEERCPLRHIAPHHARQSSGFARWTARPRVGRSPGRSIGQEPRHL